MKNYIKNLEYNIYYSFGKRYLSVSYNRGLEYNKYTLINIPIWVKDEKTVRKFLNN